MAEIIDTPEFKEYLEAVNKDNPDFNIEGPVVLPFYIYGLSAQEYRKMCVSIDAITLLIVSGMSAKAAQQNPELGGVVAKMFLTVLNAGDPGNILSSQTTLTQFMIITSRLASNMLEEAERDPAFRALDNGTVGWMSRTGNDYVDELEETIRIIGTAEQDTLNNFSAALESSPNVWRRAGFSASKDGWGDIANLFQ